MNKIDRRGRKKPSRAEDGAKDKRTQHTETRTPAYKEGKKNRGGQGRGSVRKLLLLFYSSSDNVQREGTGIIQPLHKLT